MTTYEEVMGVLGHKISSEKKSNGAPNKGIKSYRTGRGHRLNKNQVYVATHVGYAKKGDKK